MIETRAFDAALGDNEEALRYELEKLLPGELRQAILAAFLFAEIGQDIERERIGV